MEINIERQMKGNGERVSCTICGRMSIKLKLKRHQRTNLCLTTKNKNLTTQEQLDQQKFTELTEQAMINEEINDM